MPTLTANGIRIAFDTAGDAKSTPVLLVHGLGMQLTELARRIRRRPGRARFLRHPFRPPRLRPVHQVRPRRQAEPRLELAEVAPEAAAAAPLYRLDDMADDALGVLSALGVARAHLVGVAMGGMVAQILAARHPQRVLSLTSIMSSSGKRGLPGPTPAVRQALLRRRPTRTTSIPSSKRRRLQQAIGSPAYPTPEKQLRRRAARALRRCYCPAGTARQMEAVGAAPERSELLRAIAGADPGHPRRRRPAGAAGLRRGHGGPGAGRAPRVIEGMGHDLPAQLNERMLP
jgi:pimeloyl-ACP methyl ester carboxylesterase